MEKLVHISVILPTYNGTNYIVEAVESVLAQTFNEFELIVVDDGSTHDIQQVLEKYIQENDLTYVRTENKGPGAARNLGSQMAKGEYLAFIDDDDIWQADKLQKQFDLLNQNPSAVACYTDAYTILPDGVYGKERRSLETGKLWEGKVLSHLIFTNFIPLSSTVVRKSVFERMGKFSEIQELFLVEDYDLWLRFAAVGDFCVVDEPLIYYRTRAPLSRLEKIKTYKKLVRMYSKQLRNSHARDYFWYLIGLAIVTIKLYYHTIKTT